ncbi:hypothetical protein A3860_04010 [Niastella vici]|uniref:Uncharacterized protein n=1 Tax=Niastella vici TaxID=1703345 RepID=A0A1V9FRD6_9BACT|nr:hypothetical protein A3860_04010 [Niastella vici]
MIVSPPRRKVQPAPFFGALFCPAGWHTLKILLTFPLLAASFAAQAPFSSRKYSQVTIQPINKCNANGMMYPCWYRVFANDINVYTGN